MSEFFSPSERPKRSSHSSSFSSLFPPNRSYINYLQENSYVQPYIRLYSDPRWHLPEALWIPYHKTTMSEFFFPSERPRRPSHFSSVECRPSGCNFHKCLIINFIAHNNLRNLDVIDLTNFLLLSDSVGVPEWNITYVIVFDTSKVKSCLYRKHRTLKLSQNNGNHLNQKKYIWLFDFFI